MNKIYGIIGKARSGKDTVGKIILLYYIWKDIYKIQDPVKFIEDNLDNQDVLDEAKWCNWSQLAFADSLKECVAAICNIPIEYLYEESFKMSENCLKLADKDGHIYTYRELLQKLGTEVGRTIDPELWINSLLNKIDFNNNYIITDIRFSNEADRVVEAGGYIIKVEREGIPIMNHSSETGLPDYPVDFLIENNGTIKDLINNVIKILEQ